MASIDNAIYDRIAAAWWSDESFMALLRNSVNPPRFEYFREILAQRFGKTPPLLSVLDVGCGGGLLSERFAAIGCAVTGIDRSLPTLAAARDHARSMSLAISYQAGDAAALPFNAAQFDVVCCCDVLEHVDDFDSVIAEIARVIKPGGVFFFDTINRTWRSKLIAIKLAQDWAPTRLIPRNLHVWEKFIRPRELAASLERHGLLTHEFAGLSPAVNPLKALVSLVRLKLGWINFGQMGNSFVLAKSKDLSLSYMGFAARSAPAAISDVIPEAEARACTS
ncbi:MAG: 3-demethylubiquinone-9 3-O-methyltransferase [Burkholderiaceae bacterium]|nr:3-demethylubiquinone-9 3-O-methyltransferase [Burkholderiaceae bacterium]